MDKTKICLSFWYRKGRANRIRREEKEKKKRREEGKIKKSKGMEKYGFLYRKNQTINPFFFNEFGSKRTLLGILVVFGSFRLDLELFWFDFVVDLGLYGN